MSVRPAKSPIPGSNQAAPQTFKADFVLMRSVCKGTWTQDSTNKLFALMHAGARVALGVGGPSASPQPPGLPAVNSLFATFWCGRFALAPSHSLNMATQLSGEGCGVRRAEEDPAPSGQGRVPAHPTNAVSQLSRDDHQVASGLCEGA